ncbi:MAG: hypothetical protein LBL66_02095, partial [Clostridiales bacterium]|nr:hypothetical protein [Clostridiales bacterium]
MRKKPKPINKKPSRQTPEARKDAPKERDGAIKAKNRGKPYARTGRTLKLRAPLFTRLPYALAKERGIETGGMRPREVWDALESEGIDAKEENKRLLSSLRKKSAPAVKREKIGLKRKEAPREVPSFSDVVRGMPEPKRTARERVSAETVAGRRYYDVDEGAARHAKHANSYYDYKEGSATAEYRQAANEVYDLAEKRIKGNGLTPENAARVRGLADAYARKMAAWYDKKNRVDGRVPSMMITGGGNFPTRAKEK